MEKKEKKIKQVHTLCTGLRSGLTPTSAGVHQRKWRYPEGTAPPSGQRLPTGAC